MRAADPMHRRIVPRDSVALVYAERAKGDSNLKGLFLAAGVAWAVFVIREAMKPKIEIEFDMPKIMPGT